MRDRATVVKPGEDVWPAADVEARPRILEEVAEAEEITLRYFPQDSYRNQSTVIQAGGNCGLWPRMFAGLGFYVHTFEPDPTNFLCLVQNCDVYLGDEIMPYMAALSNEVGWGMLKVDPVNVGAHYLKPGTVGTDVERVRLMPANLLELRDRVAMIQLDVEGAEVIALQGASEIIRQHKPLLWLEDKGLTERVSGHPSAEAWLRERWPQYRVVERFRRDIVLAWHG